jgi:hypothetical protein
MPSYRYSRRPQEIDCRSDRNDTSEDPVEEMVCLPFSPFLLLLPSSPPFWLNLACLEKATANHGLTDRYTVYKDHVSLRDYEINDGMSLEMY